MANKKVLVSFHDELLEEVETCAGLERQNRTDFIREACRRHAETTWQKYGSLGALQQNARALVSDGKRQASLPTIDGQVRPFGAMR